MRLNESAPEAYQGFVEVAKAIKAGPLAVKLQELIKIRASQLNGCAYCVDLHTRDARRFGEPEDRIHHLTVWRESPLYDDAERAALAYTEAVTRREPVTDELWSTLNDHFDEKEVANVVALVSLINALNLIGVPLRMRPPNRTSAA
ncbi:carboxymuconolactone decarboxylase family protein [Actinomadura rudentiformis]|uniref:Carboxymuconolactone decarboxylase family protein n=2 Tax=Actinomadura rudentiformis TaxID=359158 RepID=A0A6H9YQ51_9ACTN|nr:carboxymuconolactone decarboxylase family protein [Actinomadura rudentiformis]